MTGAALLEGPANPDRSSVNGDRREILVRVNGAAAPATSPSSSGGACTP
ncbi:hypothetical protein ACFQ0M_06820 [Kitasatospora aburaviensis]